MTAPRNRRERLERTQVPQGPQRVRGRAGTVVRRPAAGHRRRDGRGHRHPVGDRLLQRDGVLRGRLDRRRRAPSRALRGPHRTADGRAVPGADRRRARCRSEVQFRAMELAGRERRADVPARRLRADPSVLGQPFFVMGFVEGVIPADVPRYSEAGFLVDEATPEQRRRMVRNGLEAMAERARHRLAQRRPGLARRQRRRRPDAGRAARAVPATS